MGHKWRPHVDWTQPEEERDVKWLVSLQLNLLERYLTQFRYAASLMAGAPDCGRDIHETTGWMEIAGGHSVMTVYHFGVTLRYLKTGAGKAPSLRIIDSDALKRAWNRFLRSFPDWEDLRHAVGHLADDVRTPEKVRELFPPDAPLIVGLMGGGFGVNYRGKTMILAATNATALELEAIMTEAWEAFRPASVWQ